MKKLAALSVCMIIAAAFVSCGDSNKKSDKSRKNSESGSDKAAREYVETYIGRKKDGEKLCTLIFPDEYIEKLKDSNDWEDEIDYWNDEIDYILRDYKVNVEQIEKVKELDDLKCAEIYFISHRYIDSIDVTKGYEYTAKVRITNRESGEKEIKTENFCVVEVNDDWKVIPADIEYLEEYYSDFPLLT